MTDPRRVELLLDVPWSHPAWELEDGVTMPYGTTQDECARVLVSLLRRWIERTGRSAEVHRDRAVRWDEAHPAVGVDPDVCLLEPAPDTDDREFNSICLWRPGFSAPRLAIEIVSDATARKDYVDGPKKYAACGVQELWVYDPHREGPDDDGGPWAVQVWERGRNGRFRRTYAGDGPAWSAVLGAWIHERVEARRLRVCDDEEGARAWPTADEEADAARAVIEAERAEKQSALARLAALEAELAALRGG